jgi:hypothetical protein
MPLFFSLRYSKITVLDASIVPSSGLLLNVYGNPIERISRLGWVTARQATRSSLMVM